MQDATKQTTSKLTSLSASQQTGTLRTITGFLANSGRFRFARRLFCLLAFQIICFFNTAQSQYQPNSRTLTLREVTQQSQTSTQTQSATPHPAVVRVIAQHGQITSYGSGTLIAKKPNYGFIITNWHVVSDTNGYVRVRFPDKKEYNAAVVAVDDRWDLALLVIPEPKDVTPVVISSTIPRKGDNYWVAGYRGDGAYRMKGGRCLAFQLPEPDSVDAELIDIGVPAESGDSGGPVFNSRSELAGVLFGSDSVTTVASHCGRVIKFLEQAAPHIASLPTNPESVINAASLSQESILDRGTKQLGNVPTHETISVIIQQNLPQSSVSSSSSSSFGGSGLRLRENTQNAQTKSFTQRKRHGFINLQYDTTHTAARSNTGGYYANSAGNSSGTMGTGSNGFNSSSTSLAVNTSAAPTGRSANGVAINVGTTNSDTTGSSLSRQSIASSSMVTGPTTTGLTTSSPTTALGTTSYAASTTQYEQDNSTRIGYGTSGATSNYETIPSMASSSNRTAATPVSTAQAVRSSNGASYNRAGSRAATATPAYSQNTTSRTTPQTSTGGWSDSSTFRPRQGTTPGGVRDNSESSYGNTRYEGEASPPASYNSYSSNSRSGAGDSDLHSQYALDSSDMQADDYAPKYAEEYADYGDTASDPSTAAGDTKFDTIKIVVAILVIFSILFYTIKAMAIAEERV